MDPALVGLLGVFLGVVLSNSAARLLDAMRRRERVRDVQTALRAEIRSDLHRLETIDRAEHLDAVIERIEGSELTPDSYTPFVPRESESVVFDAVAGEIHLLPTETVDAVVLYFKQMKTIAQFVEDLRGDRYRTLEVDRKVSMYQDYFEMLAYSAQLAEEAISALDNALERRAR
jgi:hypothetical protein